jgi:hypothetical protein
MTEDHPLSVDRDYLFNILQLREEGKVYKILVGESEGKRLIGRPRRRWENMIGMGLMQIGLEVWIGFDFLKDKDMWKAVMSAVINIRVLTPRS